MVQSLKVVFVLISCFLGLGWCYTALTPAQVTQIKEDFVGFFAENPDEIPPMVRLTFHDCVGDYCNGCINKDNRANGGLQDIAEAIEELYDNNYSQLMSRADCWALAGIAAIEQAININNELPGMEIITTDPIEFEWGRVDCENANGDPWEDPSVNHQFPPGTLDGPGDLEFFKTSFNMNNPLETVAIIGAHTLGEADGAWNGVWTKGQENAFNNLYFKNMVDESLTWTQVENPSGFWQWNGEDEDGVQQGFALPSDMGLWIDLDLDGKGKSSCDFDECKISPPTGPIVDLFARDQDFFIYWYNKAHKRMISKAPTELELIPYVQNP